MDNEVKTLETSNILFSIKVRDTILHTMTIDGQWSKTLTNFKYLVQHQSPTYYPTHYDY